MEKFALNLWLQWQQSGLPLLDVRSPDDYVQSHVSGATSIPFSELRMRRHELPDRGASVYVLQTEHIDDVRALLQDWGYLVIAVLPWDEHSAVDFARVIRCESGTGSRQLWQSNSLLPRVMAHIEKTVSGRCALDVACGAGRDSLYLAQRDWQVTAVDLQHDALTRLRLSAERLRLSIDTVCQNIERDPPLFASESFDLIVVVRYLHRPLLPHLAQWLNRGGYLVYQQFHADAAAYGKPRSSAHLLRDGELASYYPQWTTIVDDVERLSDGRPMVNFVARKPL